jgi:hypothetical protein
MIYPEYIEYQNDIEKQNLEALKKNNDKLDKLCKNICLIIGWSLVFCLFLYIILSEIFSN